MTACRLLMAVAALALTLTCGGPRQKARQALKAGSRAFTPEAFIACVKYDNLNSTKTYLTAGMNPDVADSLGWTALMWAAKDANLPVLKALIAAKVDLNQKTKDGLSAYRIAAAASRWEMASALKEAGAQLSPSDLSAFHLTMAKQALADRRDPKKDILDYKMAIQWGRVVDARIHLAAIPKDAEEFAAAQKLLKEVSRRDKELKKAAEAATRRMMIARREALADKMETVFLASGMDVTVKLSGEDKTTIRLVYVLWSRPLIYQFVTTGDLTKNLRNAGFKKLIFDDKYEKAWTLDLVKDEWR